MSFSFSLSEAGVALIDYVTAAFADLGIAASLFVYLRAKKSAFASTQAYVNQFRSSKCLSNMDVTYSIVRRYSILSIETGFVTSLWAVGALIGYLTNKQSNVSVPVIAV